MEDSLSHVEEVNEQIRSRNVVISELKEHLAAAQDRMKVYADKKRRDVHLQVGDSVFLKLRPYRMRSVARKLNEKLSPRFYGPFKVLEKIGEVAHRLNLPSSARIHSTSYFSAHPATRTTLGSDKRERAAG